MRYGALILTLDEALHIEECVSSLTEADPLVVIDSGSQDGTLEAIARSSPRARVVHRPFVSFSDQRNHGLRHCFEPGQWVLHLDADERLPRPLADELRLLEPPAAAVAYNIASLTFLKGRPVPRASGFPVFQTRLTRAGSFEFEEVGHGQKPPLEVGTLPTLKACYHHHPFEKSWEEWRARHERYAAKEAAYLRSARFPPWKLALADPLARRRWLRQATLHVPLRPWAIWAYLLILRGGVFEGFAGLEYCRRRRFYEEMLSRALRG